MKAEKWTTDNIPDQAGRVVIVTGSNSGIGYEAAKVLAEKHAQIIIAVRSLEKGEAARTTILASTPEAKVTVSQLDLANLQSVKLFSEKFHQQFNRLDILINNAGIMIPPYSKTVDGFESQMGTNHLGHFALTSLLYDLLSNTPGSRVTNVSSNAHNMGKLDFDDLQWESRKYVPFKAYGDSKIANLYFTFGMARRLEQADSQVMATAAHPGLTQSNLTKSKILRGINQVIAENAFMGALPTLMAATETSAKNGDYFGPSGWSEWRGYPKLVHGNKLSRDEDLAKKLWDISENLTGVKFQI